MNTSAIKKWSQLHGEAVMTITTGKKLGTIEDFYYNPTENRIHAFKIKTGLFSTQFLYAGAINAIGVDAATVEESEQLREEKQVQDLVGLIHGHDLLKYRVMSTGGTLIGEVGEIHLNIAQSANLRIEQFELGRNLLARLGSNVPVFTPAQVTSYGHDVIVIPDEVALRLK